MSGNSTMNVPNPFAQMAWAPSQGDAQNLSIKLYAEAGALAVRMNHLLFSRTRLTFFFGTLGSYLGHPTSHSPGLQNFEKLSNQFFDRCICFFKVCEVSLP